VRAFIHTYYCEIEHYYIQCSLLTTLERTRSILKLVVNVDEKGKYCP